MLAGRTSGVGRALRPLLADLLRSGTPVRLEVTGHSMSPFIRSGDVVTIEPLVGRRPALGEVVALAPEGRLRVHRLVGWDRGRALFRGDVAAGADPVASPDDLLGRVTRVERGGRRVRLGLGSSGCRSPGCPGSASCAPWPG